MLCPWCIADGSAAAKYDAHFIGDPIGDDVPLEVVMSVDACTPGFSSWQNPRWFFHCGEGKAFMGVVGAAELAADTWRTWTSRSAVRRLRPRPGPTVGEGTVGVRPAEQLGRGVVGVVAEVDQGVDSLAPQAVGRWVKQAASEIVEDLQAALTELAATAETLEKAEIDSPRLTQPRSMGSPRCGCARQDGG
ncbi:CbrC family protein [Streptomyces sp. NPDC059409]|uniref:CbrC family protein n=1 Tax=Streptomyces sp. NPDC059409 TaxID=3346824 RepID=UPI0036754E69